MRRLGASWPVCVDFLSPSCYPCFCVPFIGFESFQLSIAKVSYFPFMHVACFEMQYFVCLHVSKICLCILQGGNFVF